MLGNFQVTVATEQIVYPLDSEYYPVIRVFEAPYSEGDCPVDEIIVNGFDYHYDLETDTDVPYMWAINEVTFSEGYSYRAYISNESVFIRCTSDNEYELGKDYELRVYPSDELVQQEETPSEE